MLYKKSKSKRFDKKLFENPTSEYRGAPFWAWNCRLQKDELMRQTECLKKMGMGGFHIHTRSGMATKYLGDEFMTLVKECVEKAKSEKMLAWLYDEDRWPSGSAGGYVTKTPLFRERNLTFTTKKEKNIYSKQEATEKGKTYFIAAYDIVLNENGELLSYKYYNENDKAQGTVWYAYCKVNPPVSPGWHNGQTYVDTLNPKAIKRFIEITHERYKKAVGNEFGKTVPAIFTDEPQFVHKQVLPFAQSKSDVLLPWTPDFDETYKKAYGISVTKHLPELFWELPNGKVSVARYYYHDHICERFTQSFSDTCGRWCADNNIYLTGHMMEESTLKRQTAAIGEAMRAYRSFELPGVDMLCNLQELDTVKQAQSASRQYGREGVLSELYGVTNWDFDFRGHKHQGDWQAALGVTARVHHLSWVSMKGAAKRDYPASINYQSPWYEKYAYIENHFARLNTVLTRGKSVVKIGVIHPIESYWLHWGPAENTSLIRQQKDDNFKNIIEWLLFGTVDFDFISEACMPALCKSIGPEIQVGEMNYSVIIVPGCETLRKTTVDILNKFTDVGGKVIFMGEAPRYVDAKPDNKVTLLYERAERIPYEQAALINSLSAYRDIEIRNITGEREKQFLYQMRKDGDCYNLFIARARVLEDKYCSAIGLPVQTVIKIKGEFKPIILNTLTGKEETVSYIAKNGYTLVYYSFFENDSLLLRLKGCKPSKRIIREKSQKEIGKIDFKDKVNYKRGEDNVCILDLARFSFDTETFSDTEEILRIDMALRKKLGWSLADGQDIQPWAIKEEKTNHFVNLLFELESETELENTCFCAEEIISLSLNGERVKLNPSGYFVDKAIVKYPLPKLCKGKNVICAKVPFGKRISLEACYITGNFDVRAEGCKKTLCAAANSIGFGDITRQGMPFYGGNIKYYAKINIPEDCDFIVNIGKYAGALTEVKLDERESEKVVFAPYNVKIKNVSKGEHMLEFTFYGNRYNTFGALHNCGDSLWFGANYWYSSGNAWCYEYNTKPTGILKSPVITMLKGQKND